MTITRRDDCAYSHYPATPPRPWSRRSQPWVSGERIRLLDGCGTLLLPTLSSYERFRLTILCRPRAIAMLATMPAPAPPGTPTATPPSAASTSMTSARRSSRCSLSDAWLVSAGRFGMRIAPSGTPLYVHDADRFRARTGRFDVLCCQQAAGLYRGRRMENGDRTRENGDAE